MGNTKNFYTSAYIAFGSYFLLLSLFFLYVSTNDVKKFDSISKDTTLELDIIIKDEKQEKVKKLKVQTIRKDNKISKKVVKKSSSVSAKQKTNLKSLFANVKTKSKVIKKEKVSNVKKSSIASRFKSKFEKQKKSENVALSKLLDNKEIKVLKLKSGDTKYENDTYISKIYDILYNKWNPLVIVDGLSAKVIVTINYNGKFGYRFVQYSGDSAFDNQLKKFLEKQKLLYFPKPNKNKINIEVIFTAKG